ncbi:uncharacterized protein LOC126817807 isoform X2 [Patella vulgata]|uniref:uncharacterized protein LOC126817807 isoform X2 n=1 Tax=Patella vulgata TaxID=6465 RepID=UPI0024A8BBE2|nr:uncharacterized protein LOC126817807 isoform X2 [Patella vulgata]
MTSRIRSTCQQTYIGCTYVNKCSQSGMSHFTKFLPYFPYLLFIVIWPGVVSLSCTGQTTICAENSTDCYVRCKENSTNVYFVSDDQRCASAENFNLSSDGRWKVNTSTTGDRTFSCCSEHQSMICSLTLIIYEIPRPVNDLSCKVHLEKDHELQTASAYCDVQQNGSFALALNITSKYYRAECENITDTKFKCPFENVQTLSFLYTIIVSASQPTSCTYCGNETAEKQFPISPLKNIHHSDLILHVQHVTCNSTMIKLKLPEDTLYYFPVENEKWEYNIAYFPSSSPEQYKQTLRGKVHSEARIITISDLHPYENYTFSIKWKYIVYNYWSDDVTINITTRIGVPNYAPVVPNKNHAKGVNETAIYLQKNPEESENGPIINYIVNITYNNVKPDDRIKRSSPHESKKFDGSSLSIFLPLPNDEKDQTLTVQSATEAGVSPKYTTIYVPANRKEIDNDLTRLESQSYNETHDQLDVEDVATADRLDIFWCLGIYLSAKKLVDCKSGIHYVTISPATKTIIIPRPKLEMPQCSRCVLHYAVAMEKNNLSSSMLWDSASEPKLLPIVHVDGMVYKIEEHLYWIIIPIAAVLFGFFVFTLYKCNKWRNNNYMAKVKFPDMSSTSSVEDNSDKDSTDMAETCPDIPINTEASGSINSKPLTETSGFTNTGESRSTEQCSSPISSGSIGSGQCLIIVGSGSGSINSEPYSSDCYNNLSFS